MEMAESQNQRDHRVEELWQKLDPQKKGELDLKGLQKGLRKMDHRQLGPDTFAYIQLKLMCGYSSEKCGRHDKTNHGERRYQQGWQDPV